MAPTARGRAGGTVADLIEAIAIKRKMFFEHEGSPYHCLDVEISRPTARGGQTLVRVKMRNLLTRAVFDRTFKAADKFQEPDLEMVSASFLYSAADGYHFMDQESFDTLTLGPDVVGEDRYLLVDNVLVQVQKYNGRPIGLQFSPHVELTVTSTEPGVRGDPLERDSPSHATCSSCRPTGPAPADAAPHTTTSFEPVTDVMIPMRDGVKLHTVILVPRGRRGAPILLTRTPYNAATADRPRRQRAPRPRHPGLRQRRRRHRRGRLHPRGAGRAREVRVRGRLRDEPPAARPAEPDAGRPRDRHLRHHRLAGEEHCPRATAGSASSGSPTTGSCR
jgi:elongation factor P